MNSSVITPRLARTFSNWKRLVSWAMEEIEGKSQRSRWNFPKRFEIQSRLCTVFAPINILCRIWHLRWRLAQKIDISPAIYYFQWRCADTNALCRSERSISRVELDDSWLRIHDMSYMCHFSNKVRIAMFCICNSASTSKLCWGPSKAFHRRPCVTHTRAQWTLKIMSVFISYALSFGKWVAFKFELQ